MNKNQVVTWCDLQIIRQHDISRFTVLDPQNYIGSQAQSRFFLL